MSETKLHIQGYRVKIAIAASDEPGPAGGAFLVEKIVQANPEGTEFNLTPIVNVAGASKSVTETSLKLTYIGHALKSLIERSGLERMPIFLEIDDPDIIEALSEKVGHWRNNGWKDEAGEDVQDAAAWDFATLYIAICELAGYKVNMISPKTPVPKALAESARFQHDLAANNHIFEPGDEYPGSADQISAFAHLVQRINQNKSSLAILSGYQEMKMRAEELGLAPAAD